ncbi:MAG: hypothetical protein ABIH92_01350 [Nanoarchaeota archaeon]
MKKKPKKKKRIKYVNPPMKWNPGLHKWEVDLPMAKKKTNDKVDSGRRELETSAWRVLLFIVLILLLTGLGGWLISVLF